MLTSLPAGEHVQGLRPWLDGDHLGREFELGPCRGCPMVWGRDFVGDSVSKIPCHAGKSVDISGGLVSLD